jgi:hypothetical protein
VAFLAIEGWAADLAAGRIDEALGGARSALEMAVDAGAGYARAAGGGRLFDCAEVERFLQWREDRDATPFWRERTKQTRRALVASTRAADRPAPGAAARSPPPTQFTVWMERTFDLSRFSRGKLVRLRLPTPLNNDYHHAVTVVPRAPPALGATISASEGRLDFRLEVPADPVVSIAARFSFVGRAPSPEPGQFRLSDREREVFLRPREGLIEVTPSVTEVAWRVAGSLEPLAAVAAFWSFMIDGFRFRQIHYDELVGPPCDWALRTRSYDCLLCSALMAALCRARGIPARIVSGHYLSRLCPAKHAWVELGIEGLGWAPFDMFNHERDEAAFLEDRNWWRHFNRRWDYRMVFEQLPLAFTGPMSVRFPESWDMLTLPDVGGTLIRYTDVADGSLIYQDRLSVDWAT